MNYYIRYNHKTMGPFEEHQISNLLQQGRFDDSVRLSADLAQWYPIEEIAIFSNIHLKAAKSAEFTGNSLHRITERSTSNKPPKDHALLFFMGFCLVAILGFATAIYTINHDSIDVLEVVQDVPHYYENSFPEIYQEKQKAIGLVVLNIHDRMGNNIESIAIGTAFAIAKNKFVTNAHVAYAVKNTFELIVRAYVIKELISQAKSKNKSLEEHWNYLGDRGIAKERAKIENKFRESGIKVRDIEIRLNHSNGKSFRVAKVQVHPNYNPGGKETGEFDVAVFEISGTTDCYFNVASKKELHSLRAGLPVASAGFPSEGLRDLNIEKPEASYATGDIKKITDFENKDAGDEYNRSISHSIPAAGGASGSPIFTSSGNVVAVLWGVSHGFADNGARIASGVLQNFAVRIDQIYDVGEAIPWEKWINDPIRN